ncbi:hypothetical protein K456DRAFT_309167 [Colletotrichum gloeosporioides 23]|nr:hypothetical protein K456DRAFT_309167 [Colletotrichum gloeosporioides 23]
MAMDECPKDFPLVVVLIVDPLPAAREHIIPPQVFLTTSSVYHHSKHQAVCATPIPISRSHFGAFIRPLLPLLFAVSLVSCAPFLLIACLLGSGSVV